MAQIERTVVLTGAHAGKTINLRGIYPFTDGELTLIGDEQDVNAEVRALEINFSAFLKGDPRIDVVITEKPSLGGERVNPADVNSKLTSQVEGAGNGLSDLQSSAQGNTDGQGSVQGAVLPDGRGLDEAPANLGGGTGTSETGTTGGLSDGDGQQPKLIVSPPKDSLKGDDGPATATKDDKLARSVKKLDHKNDEHWTKDGKPSLAVVATFYGSTAVTRGDVEAAAPGYRREK